MCPSEAHEDLGFQGKDPGQRSLKEKHRSAQDQNHHSQSGVSVGWLRLSQRFPGGSVVKNLPVNAGAVGSVSGSGRSFSTQYSCLENPMDRGSLAGYSVHRVAEESDTA